MFLYIELISLIIFFIYFNLIADKINLSCFKEVEPKITEPINFLWLQNARANSINSKLCCFDKFKYSFIARIVLELNLPPKSCTLESLEFFGILLFIYFL